MVNLSTLTELGLVVGTQAASSKVLSKENVRRLYQDETLDGAELKTKRTLLSFAVTLALVGSRWKSENKKLATMALLAKLLNMIPTGPLDDKASTFAAFLPIACVMWTKWPRSAAGLDNSVHPEFTSTMGKLLGLPGRKAVQKFAANPEVSKAMTWGDFAHYGVAGWKWGIKALLSAYVLQALVMNVAKGNKKLEDLVKRLKQAVKNALRTSMVYQFCASFSLWAFGFFGIDPPLWGAFPVVVFLVEPLNRLQAIGQYYAAHFLFAHYTSSINTLAAAASPVISRRARGLDSFITAFGLPFLVMLYSATGESLPMIGALKSITL